MKNSSVLRQRQRGRRADGNRAASRVARLGRACLAGVTFPFLVKSDLERYVGDSRRPLTFSGSDPNAFEAEIYAHLVPVKRRIWLQRSLLLLFRAVLLCAGIVLLNALARFLVPTLSLLVVPIGCAIVGLAALILIARQRVTYADAARVLDRRLGLDQVVGTAVELTANGIENRMARLQLHHAIEAVRRVESSDAIGIQFPRRDAQALGAVLFASVLVMYLSTLTFTWPGTVPGDELSTDPTIDLTSDFSLNTAYLEGEGGVSTLDPELFDRSFDEFRGGLENLSPEELAQRISEIQASMALRAEALNRQRQALADLADALSDSSTSIDIADSIRKGDYQRAASRLSELGKQSGQLSARARRDLAQRLNDAATKVGANNQDLANRMRRAAQQLASGDEAGTQQALSDLGEGVNQAGQQLQQDTDAGGSYDPNSMESGGMPSDIEAEGLGGLSDFQGAGENGELGDAFGTGFDSNDLNAEMGNSPGKGAPSKSDGSSNDSRSIGAGAGSGPGGIDQNGTSALQKRQVQGKLLELRGRPTSDGGSSEDSGGDRIPLVSSNDGSVAGMSGSNTRSVIVDPLSVRGEQNFVPWDKRQIVKDYFSGKIR